MNNIIKFIGQIRIQKIIMNFYMSEEELNSRSVKYVQDVLKGLIRSVQDVPRTYHKRMIEILTELKKAAIKNGRANIVRKIQKVLSEFPLHSGYATSNQSNTINRNYSSLQNRRNLGSNSPNISRLPRVNKKSATAPVSNKISPRGKSYNINRRTTHLNSNEKVLDDIINDLVNGKSYVPDSELLPDLISYTKNKVHLLLRNNEFNRAQRYEEILQQLIYSKPNWEVAERKTLRKTKLTDRLNAIETNKSKYEDTMKGDLEKYDQRINEIKEKEEIKWKKEMVEYDKETNGDVPSHYQHSSQKLLNLRKVKENLIKTRRYEEAGLVNMEIETLEKTEAEENRKVYIISRETKKAQLIEAHNQKMKCFDDNSNRIRERILNDNKTRLDAIDKGQTQVQREISDIDHDIKETYANYPPPSPSRPYTTHKSPTFLTQTLYFSPQSSVNSRIAKQRAARIESRSKSVNSSPDYRFRPIPSQWRNRMGPQKK